MAPFRFSARGPWRGPGWRRPPIQASALCGAVRGFDRPGRRERGGLLRGGPRRFLAGAIRALPLGVFTAVARADYVDRDRNRGGADQQRLTLGLNFRPTEETVFKNDVLFDRARVGGASDWGDTETSYRFSLATYF